MKIKDVYIRNFRGYGNNNNDSQGYYRFESLSDYKLVLFSGFNGFGKTSFFDAIEWCLTDRISRLEGIKDKLMVTNLQSSHHLKFANASPQDYVEVAIRFDDGTYLKRKTKDYSTMKRNYSSDLLGEMDQTIDLSEIKSKLVDDKLSIVDVLNLNFLGQDSVNKLIRESSATKRTSEFMGLLGLNSVSDLVENSKSQRFNKISQRISILEDKLIQAKKVETQKKEIFDVNKYESFDEYQKNVNSILKKLADEASDWNNKESKWILENINDENYEEAKLLDIINKVTVVKQKFDNYKSNVDDKKHWKIQSLFLSSWIIDIQRLTKLKFLNDVDIQQQISKNESLGIRVSTYNTSIEKLKIIKKEINTYSNRYNSHRSKIKPNRAKVYNIDELESLIAVYNNLISYKDGFIQINEKDYHKIEIDLESYSDKIQEILQEKDGLQNIIKTQRKLINGMSSLNDNYKSLLDEVRTYINSSETLDSCPICLNKNFEYLIEEGIVDEQSELSINETLLKSINSIISGNDDKVNEEVNVLEEYEKKLKAVNEKWKNDIQRPIKNVLKYADSSFEYIINSMIDDNDNKKKCNNNSIKTLRKEQNAISKIIEDYKTLYEELLVSNTENSFSLDNLVGYISSLENRVKAKEKYYLLSNDVDIVPDVDQLIVYRDRMLRNFSELSMVSDDWKDIARDNFFIKKIVRLLENLQQFKLSSENEKVIRSYFNEIKKLEVYRIEKAKLEKFNETRIALNERASGIQQVLLERKIKSNPLVLWIYQKINPHPLFQEFEIVNLGRKGTNIISKANSNIYLDHIFNSAQVNVLALSLFLGISLSQRQNRLRQIYMDDPIQSMDDLNILAYIDLIRSIYDIEDTPNLILSSHDHNFTRLLGLKLRNKKYKLFNFTGYGENGPMFEVFTNG